MNTKYQYIVFKKKPHITGETVAVINVSDMNIAQVKKCWKNLDSEYPCLSYSSIYMETENKLNEFKEIKNYGIIKCIN